MAYYPDHKILPPLGALCLDYTDDFHRPPGDVIESSTYEFPIIKNCIKGANLWRIVNPTSFPDEFLRLFVNACQALKEQGCIGIITSCGFLAQIQYRLASEIEIPIATSSLIQIPFVFTCLPGKKKIGVLTFDDTTLNKVHFNGVGITDSQIERIVVKGCPHDGVLHDIIVRGKAYIHEILEEELLIMAESLVNENPDIGAFVLECTQMPPFSKAIQKQTGLPVYDGVTMVNWFYSGLHAKTTPEDPNKQAGLIPRKRGVNELK